MVRPLVPAGMVGTQHLMASGTYSMKPGYYFFKYQWGWQDSLTPKLNMSENECLSVLWP